MNLPLRLPTKSQPDSLAALQRQAQGGREILSGSAKLVCNAADKLLAVLQAQHSGERIIGKDRTLLGQHQHPVGASLDHRAKSLLRLLNRVIALPKPLPLGLQLFEKRATGQRRVGKAHHPGRQRK